MEEILRLFPQPVKDKIKGHVGNRWRYLQEIRIRLYQPIEFIFDQQIEWLKEIIPNDEMCMFMINQLSEYSLYRMEDELREGYITIMGGHRVGLAGKVNTYDGNVKAIQHITFFNIRIAKEKRDLAIPIIPYLYHKEYFNTLLIGPPLSGKTTLLRDLARLIASGWQKIEPRKVCVIDERSEIAASIKGIPQHDLGLRTDVMDACPKAEGMMMMIRSMSPDILIVDEIGSKADVQAVLEAINAGVNIICTIHGNSLAEIKKRPSLQPIITQNIFKRYLVMTKQPNPGTVHAIYDQNEINVLKKSRCLHNEVDWSTSFHRNDNMARL